ncbi:MAG: LysR substrate-binding domain-containing protein, partial [Pseudomonas sp.]
RKLDDIYRVGHPRASAQVNRTEAQLMMILSGRYIGFLPCHAADAWVEKGLMRPLKSGAFSFSSQHYVAYKEKHFDNPLIRDMAQIIKRQAEVGAVSIS